MRDSIVARKRQIHYLHVLHRAILKALQNISRALIDGFLNNTDFTPQVQPLCHSDVMHNFELHVFA